MASKLTLNLNKEIIERAKKDAAEQKLSLSRIVETYLQTLTEGKGEEEEGLEISPYVKSISSGVNVPANLDHKKEYLDYLKKKHK